MGQAQLLDKRGLDPTAVIYKGRMDVQQTILKKLNSSLKPTHVEVLDESRGHNVSPDAQSHFKVIVVSEAFDSKTRVQRHQAIYQLLADELSGPVHALALHTYTPAEWKEDHPDTKSPPCLGGSKKNSP